MLPVRLSRLFALLAVVALPLTCAGPLVFAQAPEAPQGPGFGETTIESLDASGLVAARYVDNRHAIAERYPANPNGSPRGITALTTKDGRATILMPHCR